MHNPKAILENETHNLLWDFEIQIDHLISARRPDLVIVNEKREPAEQGALPYRQTTGKR